MSDNHPIRLARLIELSPAELLALEPAWIQSEQSGSREHFYAEVLLAYLSGDNETLVLKDQSARDLAYQGGEWLLWSRAGALVAQRLDAARASLVGEPLTLADGVSAALSGRIPHLTRRWRGL